MKTLVFTGIAGAMTLASGTALAAVDSNTNQTTVNHPLDMSYASSIAIASSAQGAKRSMNRGDGHVGNRPTKGMGHNRWGNKTGGHWNGGVHAPGGYKNYRQPARGYRLPSYWVSPSFYIGNYSTYGFSQPTSGYGWSRYYDDAVLTDQRGVIQDSVQNVDWDRYEQGYGDGYRAARTNYDDRVLMNDERVTASPSGSRGRTSYDGDWDGAYQQDGSYQGQWEGTYRDADGRVYDGQYVGTFVGDANTRPASAEYGTSGAPHWGDEQAASYQYNEQRGNGGQYGSSYDERSDELAYLENCKTSSGIGGAVIGGAIGAFAGNRIAGRGSRLGGSLIGGGVGAVAGAAVDQGTDRCRQLLKKYGGRPEYRDDRARAPAPQYQPQYQQQQSYPSGWQGGYYYPAYYYQQQQPQVTTVVVQSQPVTTTTTTTYIDEEVSYSKARVASKKMWKPASKTVAKPSPKRVWKPAQPQLKGCQQERCLYDD